MPKTRQEKITNWNEQIAQLQNRKKAEEQRMRED